jgi:RHS repeat-associated protein
VREDNGKVGFSMRGYNNGTIYDYSSNAKVNDGQWHHLAVVYDGTTGKLKFYIDGALDKTESSVVSGIGKSNSKRYGYIGDGSEAYAINGNRNNKFFEGGLDDVRYWHEALSAGQIADAFDNTLSYAVNLQANYDFDDGSLGSIADVSGNGQDGMLYGQFGSIAASVSDRIYSSDADAIVLMYSDYYPFGMQMPGRNMNNRDYSYGYNGMEKDDERKGEGNSYSTEFRQYDPLIGKWLSLDPLVKKYPSCSPYFGFNGNPIKFSDPTGLEGELDENNNANANIYFKNDGSLSPDEFAQAVQNAMSNINSGLQANGL